MSRYAGRLPTTYAEAETALRGRQVRTVVNNTRVSRRDKDTLDVQYHGNTIATFHADGTREFTNCGWNTVSTRERLNAMLGRDRIAFVQRDHVGYIEIDTVEPERIRRHADTLVLGPSGSIDQITNSREH